MNVVRHDAPGQQAISLQVKVQQRFLDDGSNFWSAQPAISVTLIEPFRDLSGKYRVLCIGITELADSRQRQGVGQTKRQVLNRSRHIEVRKIAPRVETLVFTGSGV